MKILFCADCYGTGFASATSVLINDLVKTTDWDIHLFALNMFADENTIKEKALLNYNLKKSNVHSPMLPKIVTQHHPLSREIISTSLYGLYNVGAVVEKVNPDIVFIFNDLFPVEWTFKNIKESNWKGKVIAYIPIDCVIPKNCMINHEEIDLIIATTNFARDCMKSSGYSKDIPVIYHPLKETFFRIDEEQRTKARETILKNNKNNFIIINSNKNQFRKRYDLTIEGFSIFAKDKPDVNLFLKTDLNDDNVEGRYNIRNLIKENVEKHKLQTEKIILNTENLSYNDLNVLYNICDLSLSTTSGEGFGYIPVEFAKLQIPFLVSNNTTYPELFPNYEGLIPCQPSKPIVSMTHQQLISEESHVVLLQCYKKKMKTTGDKVQYVTNFDNVVPDTFIINSVKEGNTIIDAILAKHETISFGLVAAAGVNVTNFKKIYDEFIVNPKLLEYYKVIMIEPELVKVIYDSYQLTSYIPTAQDVANKLEEFYALWKENKPLPKASLNEHLNNDYIVKRFKEEILAVYQRK